MHQEELINENPEKWRNAHDCIPFHPIGTKKLQANGQRRNEGARANGRVRGSGVEDEGFLIKSWPDCADSWKGPVTANQPGREGGRGAQGYVPVIVMQRVQWCSQ